MPPGPTRARQGRLPPLDPRRGVPQLRQLRLAAGEREPLGLEGTGASRRGATSWKRCSGSGFPFTRAEPRSRYSKADCVRR